MSEIGEASPKIRVGATFVREFMDRELVDFGECQTYYETLNPEQLCHEMAFLMSPEIRAVPFGMSGKRYYALCDVMMHCAADWRQITPAFRAKMLNLCMDFLEYNYQRTAPESRDGLFAAVKSSLEHIRTFGLYPSVADIIAQGKREHDMAVEEGPVGASLERKR